MPDEVKEYKATVRSVIEFLTLLLIVKDWLFRSGSELAWWMLLLQVFSAILLCYVLIRDLLVPYVRTSTEGLEVTSLGLGKSRKVWWEEISRVRKSFGPQLTIETVGNDPISIQLWGFGKKSQAEIMNAFRRGLKDRVSVPAD